MNPNLAGYVHPSSQSTISKNTQQTRGMFFGFMNVPASGALQEISIPELGSLPHPTHGQRQEPHTATLWCFATQTEKDLT